MSEEIEKAIEEREKQESEDRELLQELKSDPYMLEELRFRILCRKLHKQLYDLVTDAIDRGVVKVESIEDFVSLVELDLMLR